MLSLPVCVHVYSSRIPFAAAHATTLSFSARATPRPRQSRRTAVSVFSARSGRSASRTSPAQPTISPPPSATKDPSGRAIHSRSHSSGVIEIGLGVGMLRERDELDTGRKDRRHLGAADDINLLDLAPHLAEPEAVRERDRAGILDVRAGARVADLLRVRRQRA